MLVNHAGQFAGLDDLLVVHYGYFGVPCFFCLSGALFALLYFDRATTTRPFLGRYYTARFIRIFPVYWLVLAGYALTVAPVDWAALGWHAVMGHGFIAEYRNAINTPMWTLPVECAFYLVAPFLFVSMRRLRARFDPPSPATRSLSWAHAVSLFVFTVGLLGIGAAFRLINPNDDGWWKGTLFGRFAQFGLGVLTGLLLADVRSGTIRLHRAAGNVFMVAAIGLLYVQTQILDRFDAAGGLPTQSGAFYYAVKMSLAVPACLLILAAVCDSVWQRFLASRPLVYLGAISYALYLIQCASFGPVSELSSASARHFAGLGFNNWASAGMTMLVCVIVAMLVHHGFESPVQQWLRRKLGRSPSRQPGRQRTA